ncbi:MAG: hypothetical protein JSS27_12175 [Planctomycetes bacterium]|nr:hypothetical protein [Planctomycetota bacterium]
MSIIYPVLLLLIPFATFGLMRPAGLWGNLIALVNLLIAALLAMNYFEWAAGFLVDMMPSLAYYADFMALWGIFAGVAFLLKAITDRVSLVRVRFSKPVEGLGNAAALLAIGWLMLCFTAASIHVAPLGRTAVFDGFTPTQGALWGMFPDRLWLGLVQRTSEGAFADGEIFDKDGSFLVRYAARRELFERPTPKAP